MYKKTKIRVHPNIKKQFDSGYQGAQKLHTNTELPIKASKKHLLTKEQKQSNRKLAKERIYIEYVNSKFKVFKLLENRFRSHSRFGLRVTLIACFINASAS